MATLTSTGIRFAAGNEISTRGWMFQSTTTWVFYQASAPTGWTKSTSHDNKALRVVSGTGGGSAGTNSFTSTMSSFNYAGTLSSSDSTGGTALSTPQIPSHSHTTSGFSLTGVPQLFNPDGAFIGWNGGDVQRASGFTRTFPATGPEGSDASHAHPFSASGSISVPVSITVQYIDVIVCTFNG
jgi:hypothetical protein